MKLSTEDIKKFIGITILVSYLKYPKVKIFWTKTTRVQSIAKSTRRDKYFSISLLKLVVDNDIPENVRTYDKFWKVRPILQRVRQGCLKLGRQKKCHR